MKTRLYIVGYGQSTRLIRAATKLQALDFAMQGTVKVGAVKKDQLPELLQQGVKIEDATGGVQESIK